MAGKQDWKQPRCSNEITQWRKMQGRFCGLTTEHLSICLPVINPHNTIHHIQYRQLSSLLHNRRKSAATEGDPWQAETWCWKGSFLSSLWESLRTEIRAGDLVTASFIQALGSAAKGNGCSPPVHSFPSAYWNCSRVHQFVNRPERARQWREERWTGMDYVMWKRPDSLFAVYWKAWSVEVSHSHSQIY